MNTSSDSAPAQGNANGTLAEAHWVDSEIGVCFAITGGFSSNKTGATQKELLACAKSVIDHNR